MEFVKKQFAYLLILAFCITIIILIWLKAPYSEDQKLTGTLFVFTIGLFTGLFNNNLNDKQTIMQLKYEAQIKSLQDTLLEKMNEQFESSRKDTKEQFESAVDDLVEVKSSLSDQIKTLQDQVTRIDTKVTDIGSDLKTLKQVLVEKDLIKPF